MKRLLLLLIPFYAFTADYNISCVGDLKAANLKDLTFELSYTEIEDDYILLDTNNVEYMFYDSDSSVCGGSKDEVIRIEAHCRNDSKCWEGRLGKAGEVIVDYDETKNQFFNNVVIVNNLPCLPSDTTDFTVGLVDSNTYNNYDIPFANGLFNQYRVYETSYLSSELASQYRSVCKADEDPKPNADYTAQLNTLIDNTSENKNIKELNDRNKKLDDDLDSYISSLPNREDTQNDEMTDFQTSYETTLDDTYSSYSDVFGFGGYGLAPAPITFTFLDKTYEIFNISMLDEHLELIRNTFSIFAYLWGIIIVFRGV